MVSNSANRASARWLPPVVLLAILGAVTAGFGAREIAKRPQVTTLQSPAPSSSSQAALPQPGPSTVVLSGDAAAHPDQQQIRELLQRHFNAINSRNYAAWKTSVTSTMASQRPESSWRRDYSTTQDGTIVVHRIEPGPGKTLRALMTFTSTQEPPFAPDGASRCTNWWVTYPLVVVGQAYRIDAPVAAAVNKKCPR